MADELPTMLNPGDLVKPTDVFTVVNTAHGADGKPFIAFRVEHATGSSIFLFDVPHAQQLGELFTKLALEAQTGLVLPSSPSIAQMQGGG